ncbi:MAG: hypothetical protein ACYCV0_20310, partial [Desulfitobacteriaceae bacterium]
NETLSEFQKLINTDSGEKETESAQKTHGAVTRILLSPLGLSPGLLFSALRQLTPQYALVLTSKDAVGNMSQIIQHADYQGTVQEILVQDPFACFEEVAKIEAQIVKDLSAVSDAEIWVNITGGTTALQYLAQKIANNL